MTTQSELSEVKARSFSRVLVDHGLELRRAPARVLQINVGKLCNLACIHCHVEAGPGRREIMTRDVADKVIAWMRRHRPAIVDLTGGAPEMCPEFRRLAEAGKEVGAHVMVRCNLTVIFEPGQEDLPEFYARHRLELIASLPCYLERNVDFQRGNGAFDGSIRALRRFNEVGYGIEGDLPLTLVYNPVGATLPPAEQPLEDAYREQLRAQFGIEFHRLICITNVPVTRFEKFLKKTGQLDDYRRLLRDSFNPATVGGLMCRDTINVGWEGDLFDCDFNQMLDLPLGRGRPRRFLWEVAPDELTGEAVPTGRHCFGCTAGSGSSCGGALA
ncbi:MAG: arsenosugar biosynthesis radical SAM (seleno)protein ArsS [Planctomycetota bacterium]